MIEEDRRKKLIQNTIDKFVTKFYHHFGTIPQVIVPEYTYRIPKTLNLVQLESIANEILNNPLRYPQGVRTRSRKRELVLVRQCMFKIARENGCGFASIGNHFGYDHATVIYSKTTIDTLVSGKNQEAINVLNKFKYVIQKSYGVDGNVQLDPATEDKS